MNIVILYEGNFPSSSPGAKRIEYYRKGLSNSGDSVDIIPVTFNHKNRFAFLYKSLWNTIKAVNLFFRFKSKTDALLLYGFSPFTFLFLTSLAKLYKVRIYLEVNEKVGSVYTNRILNLIFIRIATVFFTECVYLFFDGFIVISENLRDYIAKHASKNASIIKIPIIIDTESRKEEDKVISTAQVPYILHSGALSDRKDGIIEVFEAFSIACNALNKELFFYLTLNVAPKEIHNKIQKIVKDGRLEKNVHFLGELTETELLQWQKNCAMVIINKPVNEQNLHNFPTKLAEFMILEIPVITTAVGEMGEFLIDNENSYLFNVNDVAALSNRIIQVVKEPLESKKIGKNGKLTALNYFDYIHHGKRLSDFLCK